MIDAINFSLSNFEFKLASTITLVLQTNKLTNHIYCNPLTN